MQELQKILEKIDETIERYAENPYIDEKVTDLCYGLNIAKDIIRKHMNDGWIPVDERLPEDEIPTPKLVTALVPDRKARWDNSETFSVIVDTDVYDPDYTGKWECYKKNVIAWCPLPEPYHPESEKEKPDWRQDMLRKFDRRE